MTQALRRVAFFVFTFATMTTVALAQSAEPLQPGPAVPPKIDPADTAWMIAATGLVLMMTIPGLALFYSGMVRKKNVLATMAWSLAATFVVSILWVFLAYSLTFAGEGAVIGTLQRAFLIGMTPTAVSPNAPTIPEGLFMIYQMTFAVITVALVAGSVADRLRFSAFVWFCVLWLLFVYVPIAHWVWGGGFLARAGTIDFAGGLVVHLNAGVAGLVSALVIGKRRGYGHDNLAPFDLSLAVIGTGLLWVGWFGFNGGSALGATPRAVSAIVSTHLAACAGACTWTALEWATRGKPSVLGMISGAVAGLGTITPASGFVTPMEGVLIGVIAGGICFWSCTWLKIKCGYDDSLDVFGVHGVGGMTGTLLAGVLAVGAVSASAETPGGIHGLIEGNVSIVGSQLFGIAVTAVWSGVATWVILKVISAAVPLRVRTEDEVMGLDVSQHGEALQ
jgi:ammonium transporter, Amt family